MMRCNLINPAGNLTALPFHAVINQVCLTAVVLLHILSLILPQVSQKDEAKEELAGTTMVIFVFRETSSLQDQAQDIGIIIDGVEVLNELPSVANAVVMLFGLCYALNMEYPKGFRFTFEALQKILMELGSNKMSSKIRKLNGELHTAQ